MILQIISGNGEVLGSKDVTGTHWTAVLNGFLNAEPVRVILDVSGVPAFTRTVDHSGNKVASDADIGPFGWVRRLSTISLDVGRWVINITPSTIDS